MSKFDSTVDKFKDLYESGNGLSYGGTAGAFTQSSGLDGGGSGTGSAQAPVRFPGSATQPDQAPPVSKVKLNRKAAEKLPASARELIQADNEGVLRALINKLANKIQLTGPEQEIVAQLRDLKKISANDDQENELKGTRGIMSDNVEMMNNPNRPHLAFSQT